MNSDKPARDELLRLLDDAGLVTVRVGELENSDQGATRSSKHAWLEDALSRGARITPEVAAHIRRLLTPAPSATSSTAA